MYYIIILFTNLSILEKYKIKPLCFAEKESLSVCGVDETVVEFNRLGGFGVGIVVWKLKQIN